jgi:hypothetical protein
MPSDPAERSECSKTWSVAERSPPSALRKPEIPGMRAIHDASRFN